MQFAFSHNVIEKYQANYFLCDSCGFMNVADPFWLEEAYEQPINETDTGLLSRNIFLHKKIIVLVDKFLDSKKCYLDYAGGYGVFTRLMRDAGFNFYHQDLYTKNIFAKSYEYNKEIHNISGITCFECLEHLIDPVLEIKKMLDITSNIFITTDLKPMGIPDQNWHYYGFEHGQHISFFTLKSLNLLANKFDLNFYSEGNFHFLSKKKINIRKFRKYVKNAGRRKNMLSSKALYEKISKRVSLT